MKGEIHSAVEVEHRRASGNGQGVQQRCVEGNLLQVTAAAFRLGLSHQVDDDVPHGAHHAGVKVLRLCLFTALLPSKRRKLSCTREPVHNSVSASWPRRREQAIFSGFGYIARQTWSAVAPSPAWAC